MPDSENMKTNMNIQFFGCNSRCWLKYGLGTWYSSCPNPCGYRREQSTWKRLYQAHQNLEMNLRCPYIHVMCLFLITCLSPTLISGSNIGNDDRRTRQGYKTKQIRDACILMEEIAANINVHQLVIDRAKEEYVTLTSLPLYFVSQSAIVPYTSPSLCSIRLFIS